MKHLIVAVALLATGAALPQANDTVPVTFPAYSSVKNLDGYADEPTYRAAVEDSRFVMEAHAYPSEGMTLHAYVYRPTRPAGRLPVVVFNRGSWTWPKGFAAELLPMAHRLAEKGYLVVAPWYRGSGGDQGRDELGGADLADLFNLVPMIEALPFADASRMFLYGESRGGMMVYQALRDGFPARAAAVFGGFTDLDAMLAEPQWAKAGSAIWPDLEANRAAIVERRSAIRWAAKIGAPVLIMHGGADKAVRPSQSLRMAQALDTLGKPFELWIAEGERHTLTGRAAERDARAAEWFGRHTPR